LNHFQALNKKLDTVERLAQSHKFRRLCHNPAQYISAQFFRTVVFPLTHKGTLREAMTFMDYPLNVLLPSGTDIYLTGGKTHDSEIRLARFLIQYFESKDSEKTYSFVDIGAHIGYFSLLASFLVGEKGQVLAFEAAKGTFDLLKKNLENRPNVQVFHHALTDTEKDLIFYEFPVLYSEYNTLHVAQFEKEAWFQKFKPEKNTVKGITLDALFDRFHLQNTVIKIDTEGAEAEVIAGAKNVLEHHFPVIIMEFLSDSNKNAGHFEAFMMLKEAGFQPFFIEKEGHLETLKDIEAYFFRTKTDSDNFVFMKRDV
jgi:FkbM family methyltransferase